MSWRGMKCSSCFRTSVGTLRVTTDRILRRLFWWLHPLCSWLIHFHLHTPSDWIPLKVVLWETRCISLKDPGISVVIYLDVVAKNALELSNYFISMFACILSQSWSWPFHIGILIGERIDVEIKWSSLQYLMRIRIETEGGHKENTRGTFPLTFINMI